MMSFIARENCLRRWHMWTIRILGPVLNLDRYNRVDLAEVADLDGARRQGNPPTKRACLEVEFST
jgi:hypothetical protein